MPKAGASTLLSSFAEECTHFRDHGYVLLRGLIPLCCTEAAKAALAPLEAGEPVPWSDDMMHHYDTQQLVDDRGRRIVNSVQGPSRVLPTFAAIATHPRLHAAADALLGSPSAPLNDQCGIKSRFNRTEQGGRTFYHQDSYYWRVPPEEGLNFWIPFDEMGREASALAVIPASHRGWKLEEHELYFDEPRHCVRGTPFKRKRIPLHRIDTGGEVLVPMQPGDALAFTTYTWHRSEPNRSGATRRFFAVAYRRTAHPASA